MVTTRSGAQTRRSQSGLSIAAFLVASLAVVAVTLSAAFFVFEGIEHKAHSLYARSSYSFGGAKAQASQYWKQVPSWDDIKKQAGGAQVLPEPSVWQHVKALAQRKAVRRVQAEDAVAAGHQWAADGVDSVKDTAAAATDAGREGYAASKAEASGLFNSVRSTLFGLRSRAQQEASRQRRLALEAQWRAEYNSHEGVLQKLKYIVTGPRRLPSTQHYDAAWGAGAKAYDHAGKAASEAAEAARQAAGGAAHAGRGAARAASGAAAGVKDVGARAAGSASEYAQDAKDGVADAAHAAAGHGQAAYDATAEAARDAADKARDAARRASHGEL